MGRLTAFLLRGFRAWEPSARLAFVLAVLLLVLSLIVITAGPENLRQPALIGAFGLLLVAQGIFMWANRGMVTPYTRAQRHYLAEDFEAARQVLEALYQANQLDVRGLTLLGNIYRQLGRLDESEQVLTEAVDLRPKDHFPLYGIGRTLLVKGSYAPAVVYLEQAVEAGAPPLIQVDLAEALFRSGRRDDARVVLQALDLSALEPHRALLVACLLRRLDVDVSLERAVITAGLPFWQKNAERFQHTSYGQALCEDVQHMHALTEES